MAKLPAPPTVAELRRIGPEAVVLPAGTRLYRIYSRGGNHPTGWGRMRHYGPVGTARFDHHSEPARVQERGILYAASGGDAITTCVAGAFQEERLVDTRRDAPWLACFTLTEDVPLLDLTGKWPTRAGASSNVNSGPHPRCRRWSRAMYEAYPDLWGLLYASSMNGGEPAVALYERAMGAVPRAPVFNRPLSDPALLVGLGRIADAFGYGLN
ncbi:MAG: RES domain-containing protein [Actinomycetota bacterium]|nr:RES domain-containing protein [Actinomycetota bacterium]